MYKIAVLGDYDSIYGFAALGLDIFPVESPEEAKKTLIQLAEEKTGIIYVTEAWAAVLKHEIDRYKDAVIPTVIQIPGVSGNTGQGIEGVKKSVEQAVGSDILFGGN
nr:V-type ATP synthase subunit F [uncultured Sellimonas sp.]